MKHNSIHRKGVTPLVLLIVALLMSVMVAPSAAQGGSAIRPVIDDGSSFELTPAAVSRIVAETKKLPGGLVSVIVNLEGTPAVFDYIAAGGRAGGVNSAMALNSSRSRIASVQNSFGLSVRELGARVTSSTNFLANTVTVAVEPSMISALARIPGVTGVFPNYVVYPQDTISVPFIGADDVWTAGPGTGYTGAGTVIAIIDSGIDYTHVHFGGDGDYAAAATDTTSFSDTGNPYGSLPLSAPGVQKVVGGWDFVGDDYNASDPLNATPAPDEDPLDCPVGTGGGHGTHVAGTAGGWGTTAAGDTYTGPFDNTLFTGYPGWTSAFRIGPGVAPEAALLALRVFGCSGSSSTEVISAAIEAAVAGTVTEGSTTVTFPPADVINMSLGAAYGTADPDYLYNQVIRNASLAGTVVVASAGNSAYGFFITGSPAATVEAISVANTTDLGTQAQGVRDDASMTVYPALYGSSSPFPHPVLTATSVVAAPSSLGCNSGGGINSSAAGKIVIIERGGCIFAEKQDNAFNAGAVGVVVYNSVAGGEELISMAAASVSGYNLPTVFVGRTAGLAMVANVNGTNTITMDPVYAGFVVETGDRLSSSSSRGPSLDNEVGTFKPDLGAPGTTILSARSGFGDLTYNISGTSMAAPHVAGMMALLKEKYPTWSVAELKALAMNTANATVTSNGVTPYGPQSVGAGRVNLNDAFGNEVIAYNTDSPEGVNLSFGFPEVVAGDTLNLTKTVTVANKSASDVTYNVNVVTVTNMTGVSVSADTTVSVLAGQTGSINVTLSGNPNVAGVNANSDPTLSVAGGRHYLTEEAGYIELVPTSGATVTLRVPFYAAPTVNSDMAAAAPVTLGAANLSSAALLPITGTPVNTSGTFAGGNDITSLVTSMELVAESAGGAPVPAADLKYVGIASDYVFSPAYSGTPGTGHRAYFGIATHGEWETPREVSFEIAIDLDQDSEWDFIVYNSQSATLDDFEVGFIDRWDTVGFGPNGAFTAGLNINFVAFSSYNTYLFNNSVMVLPVPLQWLMDVYSDPTFGHGTDTDPAFDYSISTYARRYDGGVVDSVALATYDPASPAVLTSTSAGMPVYIDSPSNLPVVGSFPVSGPLPKVLLLHHHNTGAEAAEVVDIEFASGVLFDLLSPANGAVLNSIAAIAGVTEITWEESTGATTYDFTLDRPAPLPDVVLSLLTPAADTDALFCDAGVCTLTVDLTTIAVANGTYTWNVVANSTAGTTPANAAFSFSVAVPAPTAFTLVGPANNAYLIDPVSELAAITWTESDAAAYNFVLFHLSNNVRIGELINDTYTAAADTDPLTCASGLCTLAFDAPTLSSLPSGQFAWTVIADNGYATTEASNAAFLFILNTAGLELLYNGGFELNPDNLVGTPDGWRRIKATKDRVVCNPAESNSGNCSYLFAPSATEDSRLVQLASTLGANAGTTLDFSAFVKAPNANTRLVLRVNVRYASAPTQSLILPFNRASAGGLYEEVTGNLTLTGTPTSIQVLVRNRSKVGRVRVDDISLSIPPASGPRSVSPLELPEANDE